MSPRLKVLNKFDTVMPRKTIDIVPMFKSKKEIVNLELLGESLNSYVSSLVKYGYLHDDGVKFGFILTAKGKKLRNELRLLCPNTGVKK